MKSEKEKQDQVFEHLRKLPLELSLQEVEQRIERIAEGKLKSSNDNSWGHFFNLNQIIMIVIPASVLIGFLLYSGLTGPDPTAIQQGVGRQEMPSELPVISSLEEEAIPEFESKSFAADPEEEVIFAAGESPANAQEHRQAPVAEIWSLETANEDLGTEEQEFLIQAVPPTSSVEPGDFSSGEFSAKTATVLRPLNTRELRRLKKQLYKNLTADGLVRNRKQFVRIDLPGEEIRVNETAVVEQLKPKYAELTYRVGWGPERRIEMDADHIKVGDFTKDGFKGSGVGRFEADFANADSDLTAKAEGAALGLLGEQDSEELEWEKLKEEEGARLRDYCKSVRVNDVQPKNPLAIPYDIKFETCHQLHQELYAQLISDNLVNQVGEMVLLEYPKSGLYLNGKLMEAEHAKAYEKLLDKHKFRAGTGKEVQLSEHIVAAGHVIPTGFTGSLCTFDLKE